MDFKIEDMKPADWAQVSAIYLAGIKTGIATFEKDVPSWEEWDQDHCQSCRLTARSGNTVLGWAALIPTSSRCVYAGVAEISVYIGEAYKSQGIGTALLTDLIRRSEENGFWTLQAGIIKENIPSIALHKKCGFKEFGIRERLGQTADEKMA